MEIIENNFTPAVLAIVNYHTAMHYGIDAVANDARTSFYPYG